MQTEALAQRKLFAIRLSEEETDRLQALARHYGLTVAGMLRMLTKREADALFTEGTMGGLPVHYDRPVKEAEKSKRRTSRAKKAAKR